MSSGLTFEDGWLGRPAVRSDDGRLLDFAVVPRLGLKVGCAASTRFEL